MLFWLLLFLTLASIVLLSHTSFEQDDLESFFQNKRPTKVPVLSFPESKEPPEMIEGSLEDASQPSIIWRQRQAYTVYKDRANLSCEEFKLKASALGLVFLEEKKEESMCNRLNKQKSSEYEDWYAIFSRQRNFLYTQPDINGERKKYFVVHSRFRLCTKFEDKGTIYALIGGIAKLVKEKENVESYSSFTVDEKGLSWDRLGIKHANFETYLWGHEMRAQAYLLPDKIKATDSLEVSQISIKYTYMIYQDVSLVKAPYPIQSFGAYPKLMKTVEKRLQEQCVDKHSIRSSIADGFSTIQFILFWKAVKQRVFKDEIVFENQILQDINVDLEALKDDEDEERKKALLHKASTFILDNLGPQPSANYLFLSILMAQESTIRESFFSTSEDGMFDPTQGISKEVCDHLSNELVMYEATPNNCKHPYLLDVPCRGNPNQFAAFKLVAAIMPGQSLATYDCDLSEGRIMVKIARYIYNVANPEIINQYIVDLHKSKAMKVGGFIIYQHYRADERFAKTKVASLTWDHVGKD